MVKKCHYNRPFFFTPIWYFSPKNGKETTGETIGKIIGAVAIGTIINLASDNCLTTSNMLVCVMGIILPRMIIG